MPEPEYRIAYSVAPMAATLITEHHKHLDGFAILYLFHDKSKKSKGQRQAGSAQKLTGLNRFLSSAFPDEHLDADTGYDAAIILDHELWDKHEEPWRLALLDHELCHLGVTEAGELTTVPHDVEEFTAIVQRHGVWGGETESELAAFVEAAQQLTLPVVVDGDTGEILDSDAVIPSEPRTSTEFERMRERAMAMPQGARVQ